jgi:integrase
VLTAAFTGLRFGELAALTRECVDHDAGTITVTETLVDVPSALLLGPPKSDAGRHAVAILSHHRRFRECLAMVTAWHCEPGDDLPNGRDGDGLDSSAARCASAMSGACWT